MFLQGSVILSTVGGHAWLLQGGCVVARGMCMVDPRGHVWLSRGDGHGCSGGVACMVALGGMRGCSRGSMCGCSQGGGGMRGI